MKDLPDTISPERWIVHIFSARSAAEGGTVRRKVTDVERLIGRDRFLFEIRRRGFRVVENAGQFIVFCNREPVYLLQ
ncbi:MAG: N-(5'-phosphoribosyl)anthranilate isomerase [Rhodobacter sp.]|nr:N-(5'-phosphoribosyl)anthranilate isomerase [Rhodobacter sp.]